MKRIAIVMGVFFTFLLIVSTVTAVPYTQSQPVIELIEEFEQKESFIKNIQQKNTYKINQETNGLIDLIIQILLSILSFIQQLIQFIFDLLHIIDIIEMIISAINQLINAIIQLIEKIINLFNPNIQVSNL